MFTIRVPPRDTSEMLARSAAGFIATRTLGASPAVRMSWSEMWTWNAETPARVPAGARISAGKSGIVAVSLPNRELTRREPGSGELHAVAGVAGEPDHDTVELQRLGSGRRAPADSSGFRCALLFRRRRRRRQDGRCSAGPSWWTRDSSVRRRSSAVRTGRRTGIPDGHRGAGAAPLAASARTSIPSMPEPPGLGYREFR